MARSRITSALTLWLISVVAVSAQESQSFAPVAPSPGTPTLPPPPTLSPGVRTVAPPPTIAPGVRTTISPSPAVPPGISTPIPSGNFPQGVTTINISPPGVPVQDRSGQIVERQIVPAQVKLIDGTTLAGELYLNGPLQGSALFGSIAIPLNQIRGIDWQTQSNGDEKVQKAKVILINGDALTVTLNVPTIQLKTDWGHAAIELAKIQSMVLTAGKYKWEDTPLGRQLVPDGE
jgi:hypothetical protein